MSLNRSEERQDGQLIEAARGGDESAFSVLRGRHEGRIGSLIRSRLAIRGCMSPSTHSPDVEQEAWTSIFGNLSQLKESFDSWSAIVGLNAASKHSQKCRTDKQRLGQFDEAATGGLPPARFVDFGKAYEAMLLLEQSFPEAYKISHRFGEIYEMRWREGLEFDEIARRLNLKTEAVRARYYRGVNLLAERLGLAGEETTS